MKLDIEIEVEEESKEDITNTLRMIVNMIDEGYMSGADRNETGCYCFRVATRVVVEETERGQLN